MQVSNQDRRRTVFSANCLLMCCCLMAVGQASQGQSLAHDPEPAISTAPVAPVALVVSIPSLSVEQVVTRLQEKNAERAAALESYESTRDYEMQYRGFPSDRAAQMEVHVVYHAPNSKEFSVVSQSGLKFIIEHVFKKLLEAEKEAAANPDSRRRTALTAENYHFSMAGFEDSATGGQYVLNLEPRVKNKFLYRGKIWVDARDFAVVRIKGEPGINPSFWIKRTSIEHTYRKVGEFWLPAENRTESAIRLGGVAHLSIEYKDYKILKAEAMALSTENRP